MEAHVFVEADRAGVCRSDMEEWLLASRADAIDHPFHQGAAETEAPIALVSAHSADLGPAGRPQPFACHRELIPEGP